MSPDGGAPTGNGPDRRAFLLGTLAALAVRPLHAATRNTLLRTIPSTGERIPALGLGTWQTFDVPAGARDPLRDVLQRFHELGGRVIDSSPMYGRSETVVGDLAAELRLEDRLFLATKVWTDGRRAGIDQMNTSLERLRTDRIDLMQVHNLRDADTHLDTLAGWKREGRVRYIGVTHHTASAHEALERAIDRYDVDFIQVNLSIAESQAERRLIPRAAERGVAIVVNRPFAEGALFRAVRGRPLPDWAADWDCTSWAQLFLKWILAVPAVTVVIPATSDPEHLVDNMGAGTGRLPDAAGRRRIAEAVRG